MKNTRNRCLSALAYLLFVTLAALPAPAANTSKAELLGAFAKLIPESFCDRMPILKKCITISHDQCIQRSQAPMQACIDQFKAQIPESVSGPDDGKNWGGQIGRCYGEKFMPLLKDFPNRKATPEDCKQAMADFSESSTINESDREKAATYMGKNAAPLTKTLIAKLSPEDANQYIEIMKSFPKAEKITPETHAALWKIINKMNLKDPKQIETLKKQTLGESLDHQIQIWQDALKSFQQGKPIKSPERIAAEKRVIENSAPGQADFKKADELVANIAKKIPVDMGGKPTLFDEAKINKMIAHLKDKKTQLDTLFKP